MRRPAAAPRRWAAVGAGRELAPPLPPRALRRFRPFIAADGGRFLAPEAARPARRRPPHRPRLGAFLPRGSPLPPGRPPLPAAAPASRRHEARQVSGWRRIAGARPRRRRQGSPRALSGCRLARPLPHPRPLGRGQRPPAGPRVAVAAGRPPCRAGLGRAGPRGLPADLPARPPAGGGVPCAPVPLPGPCPGPAVRQGAGGLLEPDLRRLLSKTTVLGGKTQTWLELTFLRYQ